jgi:hypothetical protein
MTIRISPEFSSLESFVRELPQVFTLEGEVLYKARNELKLFNRGGFRLNVKRYRKPIFINRVVYSFLRKSKARRAYENALFLLSKGFETPRPVAYLEIRDRGLLVDAFFVSEQCDYTRLFREFVDESPLGDREHIVRDFGKMVARLHEAGIRHLDLSVGNILFDVFPDGCRFSLVDLNRMKFERIGMKDGCQNCERLRGGEPFFRVFSEAYASERGYDPDVCFHLMMAAQKKNIIRFQKKDTFKKLFR